MFGFNRKSWEERQTEKLQRLKAKRVKSESRAKLVKMEEKEKERIDKAKKTISKSGGGIAGAFSSFQEAAQKANKATSSYYDMLYGPPKKAVVHKKKPKTKTITIVMK